MVACADPGFSNQKMSEFVLTYSASQFYSAFPMGITSYVCQLRGLHLGKIAHCDLSGAFDVGHLQYRCARSSPQNLIKVHDYARRAIEPEDN